MIKKKTFVGMETRKDDILRKGYFDHRTPEIKVTYFHPPEGS